MSVNPLTVDEFASFCLLVAHVVELAERHMGRYTREDGNRFSKDTSSPNTSFLKTNTLPGMIAASTP